MINVSSGGMYGQSIPEDDLESERARYGPKKLYARTKREEVAIGGRVRSLGAGARAAVALLPVAAGTGNGMIDRRGAGAVS